MSCFGCQQNENIIIGTDYNLKIADFGLAVLATRDTNGALMYTERRLRSVGTRYYQ
jgi:hypothetical protein